MRGEGLRFRLAALASPLALALSALACSGGGGAVDDTPARTYVVRGMVRDLPQPAVPASEFSVRHEAIDDFVDSRGEVVGMGSMTMPFKVADSVDLSGLAIGAPVEMTLEIDWDGDSPVLVTALRQLPAGTELVFRQARPEKAPPMK